MEFAIQRGTNISHWLSQSDRRGAQRRAWFTRQDIDRIAGLGLDHLRVPVDEVQMWDADGRRESEAWELLNGCLDQCAAAGLRVIVDLHILRSHYFNQQGDPALFTDSGEPQRFAGLWLDLSAVLQCRPTGMVAYELLNEPVATDAQDWNRVYRVAYQALRAAEPERWIVLGSNRWNSVTTFDALAVPENDARLILTFHYYNPFYVTHYRAPWAESGRLYQGPIHYPGVPIAPEDMAALDPALRDKLAPANRFHDAGVMAADLAQPLAARDRTGCPLYCGEFGVLHTVDDPIRHAWYRDFRAVLDAHGIAWGNWDYKGGFGLFDADGRPTAVVEGLVS